MTFRMRRRICLLRSFIVVVICSSTLAVTSRAESPRDDDDKDSPPPSQPGFGVPSKAPRPIKRITPSSTPPLERKDTLLPPTPPPAPSPSPPYRPIPHPGGVIICPEIPWWHHPSASPSTPIGSHLDGSFGSDHWRIRIHVGSPAFRRAKRVYWWRYPYFGFTHFCWWNNWPRYPIGWSWDYTDQFLLTSAQQESDRITQQETEQREKERFDRLSDLEKGNERLAQGQAQDAVSYFLKHLESSSDDGQAMRSLALALLDTDKMEQACAMMALAYDKLPRLADSPIKPDSLSGSVLDFRKRLTDVVTFGHWAKTGSAWLTAAVLAQAEGRENIALRLAQRAKATGMTNPGLDRLINTLTKNPQP